MDSVMLTEGEYARLCEVLDNTLILKSAMKPSEWYEANMVMPSGGPFPGPIRYDRTPYWREVVDCSDPNHPARDVTIMGPAQMGKSIMVLNPIVGYSIAMDPCNILFLTGHTDLTKGAMLKIDFMIQNTGLQPLIMPSVLKARNNRTGDTLGQKEFRGGDLKSGSITNHNLMRQNTVKKSIADDIDAGQMQKEATGGTIEKIKSRTKAHENDCKRYWVSTPQRKGLSLVENQLKKSDRRNWFVECPCCQKRIDLKMPFNVDDKNAAGLVWKLDNLGRVDFKSVGYVCQLCAGFFTDSNKHELLNSGVWVPTQEAEEVFHQGYEINGLYAPHGMTSWYTLASKYVILNPVGMPRQEADWQAYWNDDVGLLYEAPETQMPIGALEKNIQPYAIGVVPEQWGIDNGLGRVTLVTCAADLGGRYVGDQNKSEFDDVRLDLEIVAHFESGATCSIDHRSIGTFRPAHMGKQSEGRELWTYDISKPNNVWKEFLKVIEMPLNGDNGRKFRVNLTGVDTGFGEIHAWSFIDTYNVAGRRIVGLKGDKEHKPIAWGLDKGIFSDSKSRNNLYIVSVGQLKDQLVARVSLKWKRPGMQPPGFMNFPERAAGKYTREGYFEHFESEHRVVDEKKGTFIWKKKNNQVQNHFMDTFLYGMALREIMTRKVLHEIIEDPEVRKISGWREFCNYVLERDGLTSALKSW